MSQAWERGMLPGSSRLRWSLLLLTLAALTSGALYEAVRKEREHRAADQRCHIQAADVVEVAACTCIFERDSRLFLRMLVMFAPPNWQELWHRAARNECLAEAHARSVTESGIEAVRPLPLQGIEGRGSP